MPVLTCTDPTLHANHTGLPFTQATQRAGRAGRTQAGRCYRLYTREHFDRRMPAVTLPEIQRTCLVSAVLYLKTLGLEGLDVLTFDFLDPPGRDMLMDALRQLWVLDAIDADGRVTALGRTMARVPLEPSLARALIAAREFGCVACRVAAAQPLSATCQPAIHRPVRHLPAPQTGCHLVPWSELSYHRSAACTRASQRPRVASPAQVPAGDVVGGGHAVVGAHLPRGLRPGRRCVHLLPI